MTERDHLRVVVVSPGDVQRERDALAVAIDELNRGIAEELGLRLSLWRWETDARPGLHLEGPQGVIDELMEIDEADIVIGIFWKRFGTPTGDAQSGTEHELRRAWDAWKDRSRPEVMVYFCQRPCTPTTAAESRQWTRVLEFKDELPEEQLWWTYTSVEELARLARQHLTTHLRRRPRVGKASEPGSSSAPAGADRRRVLFNVPRPLTYFTGREAELEAIDQTLGVAGQLVVTQAITGLGGVGKSQLAARYAQDHADAFDVVAWIRAEDGGVADLAALAAELGVAAKGVPPQEQATAALRWLTNAGDARWLLVLDNLAAPDQLDACCPRSGNGRVLVTTRHQGMAQYAPLLAVDVLDEATATDTLIRMTGRRADRAAARTLAIALGRLPLALSHAGAYCAAGTSFQDYLDLLEDLPAQTLFATSPEAFYEQTIASTWQASIAAAVADAPLAAEVLAFAAFLAPDAIPKSLFGAVVDPADATDRMRLHDALGALQRLSLVIVDDTTVSVHRLLQRTVREHTSPDDARTAAAHALTAMHTAFAGAGDVALPVTWPVCEQLFPHALAIADTVAGPTGDDGRLADVLNVACTYALHAGGGARAVGIATVATRVAERIVGPDHPDALKTRHNLAHSYWSAGRTGDALELQERVLADSERILGPEQPETLTARNNLAISYQSAGRHSDAIALHEHVLSDRTRILGAEHPGTLTTRNNLASCYGSAGRHGDAIELQECLVADRERILGPEHPGTLATRNNLASSYRSAGRHDDAIELQERVVADCGRILGPEHPGTLAARNNLANSYRSARRTGDAIDLEERVLAECERILGPEHPDTVVARDALASWRSADARPPS